METVKNVFALNLPILHVIIFLAGYILATIVTYKLMKGGKEADSRILEFKNK